MECVCFLFYYKGASLVRCQIPIYKLLLLPRDRERENVRLKSFNKITFFTVTCQNNNNNKGNYLTHPLEQQ